MVVIVGPVPNEAMLVEIADVGGKVLCNRRRNPDEGAGPVKAARSLEAGRVEIEERLGADDERGAAALVQRQRIFEIGPDNVASPISRRAPPVWKLLIS